MVNIGEIFSEDDGGVLTNLSLMNEIQVTALCVLATHSNYPSTYLDDFSTLTKLSKYLRNGLEHKLQVKNSKTISFNIFATHQTNSIYIAFSSYNLSEAVVDWSSTMISDNCGGKVHQGLYNIAESFYNEHVTKILNYIPIDSDIKLIVCGHSFCGAVGMLVTLKLISNLSERFNNKNISSINFGSPFVFDKNMMQYLSEQNFHNIFYNVVNENDLVPRLILTRKYNSLIETLLNKGSTLYLWDTTLRKQGGNYYTANNEKNMYNLFEQSSEFITNEIRQNKHFKFESSRSYFASDDSDFVTVGQIILLRKSRENGQILLTQPNPEHLTLLPVSDPASPVLLDHLFLEGYCKGLGLPLLPIIHHDPVAVPDTTPLPVVTSSGIASWPPRLATPFPYTLSEMVPLASLCVVLVGCIVSVLSSDSVLSRLLLPNASYDPRHAHHQRAGLLPHDRDHQWLQERRLLHGSAGPLTPSEGHRQAKLIAAYLVFCLSLCWVAYSRRQAASAPSRSLSQ